MVARHLVALRVGPGWGWLELAGAPWVAAPMADREAGGGPGALLMGELRGLSGADSERVERGWVEGGAARACCTGGGGCGGGAVRCCCDAGDGKEGRGVVWLLTKTLWVGGCCP